MKIAQEPSVDLSKPQIEIVDKMRYESKFIGSVRHKPGLTLFSFNIKTGEIKKAGITVEVAAFKNKAGRIQESIKRTVKIEQDCIYLQCLNKKNLIKKLIKKGIISLQTTTE